MFNLGEGGIIILKILDTTKFKAARDSKNLIIQYSLKFVRIFIDYSIENVSSIAVIHN
jgi:hypothetical protein